MARTSRRPFGSVRKRSSGRYQARYRGPDGREYAAAMTFPTVADARAYLATVQADLTRQTWKAPASTTETVAQYVARWIAQHQGIKASTRGLYERLLRVHVAPLPLGSVTVSRVTPDKVRAWNAERVTTLRVESAERERRLTEAGKRRSAATRSDGSTAAAQAYRLLRSAMATATADGLLPANPCQVKGAGTTRSVERPTASTNEVDLIAGNVPGRYYAMVQLAAWVGPRVGELGALRRRDVDLDAGILSIRERVYVVEGGTLDWDAPKSAAGVRDVTLPPHLLPILRRHMDAYTDADLDALVFTTTNGTPVTRNRFGDVFAKARVKASRPDLRVHDLRHTGQTLAALAGATEAELMHRMGHSTTAASRAYLHSTQEHSRAVADALSAYATSDNVVPLRPVHRRTKRDAG